MEIPPRVGCALDGIGMDSEDILSMKCIVSFQKKLIIMLFDNMLLHGFKAFQI